MSEKKCAGEIIGNDAAWKRYREFREKIIAEGMALGLRRVLEWTDGMGGPHYEDYWLDLRDWLKEEISNQAVSRTAGPGDMDRD